MEQIFYIEIDGIIWKFALDGRMQPLAPGELVPQGVEVVGLQSRPDLDAPSVASAEGETRGFDGTPLSPARSPGINQQSLRSSQASTSDGGSGSLVATVFGSLQRSGDEVLAEAGFQTSEVSPAAPSDSAADRSNDGLFLDPNATISIVVNDDENLQDSYVNRFEDPSVDFYGTTSAVFEGSLVELRLVDSVGQVFESQSVSIEDGWELLNQDLLQVAEGEFVVTATIRDEFGNAVSDTARSVKDTLAEGIAIGADVGSDLVIDLVEAENTRVFGRFDEVQAGAIVNVSLVDGQGRALTFDTQLGEGGGWTSVQDLRGLSEGILLLTAETRDEAGNPARISTEVELILTPPPSPVAALTLIINDDKNLEDGFVNRFENPAVDFSGVTRDIPEGSRVQVTIVDNAGQRFELEAITDANSWSLLDQDLSDLAEGPFTVTASVRDNFGRVLSDSASSVKDTLAEGVSIGVELGADQVLDLFEAARAPLFGQFRDVQAGALVDVTVSDSSNQALRFSTTLDAQGNWQIAPDLRGLAQGPLTLRASTVDLAGNPAEIVSQPFELTTSPSITLENPDQDGVFDDGIYNQFEVARQTYFGSVFNVEEGQTVTLTLTDADGNSQQASAQVAGGEWSVTDLDVSALGEGPLTVEAQVSNNAGVLAQAALMRGIDKTADMDTVVVDPNQDGVLNALEALALTLQGAVVDIEAGQPVALTITDGQGRQFNAVGQVQGAGLWVASNVDLSEAAGPSLSVSVSAMDIAGNPAEASSMIAYDPTATIADEAVDNVDGDRDQLFNAAEVAAGITLSGVTDNIEAGQPLTILIADGVNPPVVQKTVVQNATGLLFDAGAGTWQVAIDPAQLAGLEDGDLTVSITGSDVAGNIALGSDVIRKDTTADISVDFRGDTPDDDLFSSGEITAVAVGGIVTDVEPGREVTVVVSGLFVAGVGQPDIAFTTLVQNDGTYSSLNNATDPTYDLSRYDDGPLMVKATVADEAGNEKSAENTATKDTELTLDIDTGANGLTIREIKTGIANVFSGTTTAEEGQLVTLTFDDGSTQFTAQALVNAPNQWVTGAYDSGGLWQPGPIAVTGLTRSQPWSLNAQVEDLAGNVAIDDTPTLIQPLPVVLSEGQLIVGTGTDVKTESLRIDIGGDPSINVEPFTFSEAARQLDLADLRSAGSETTVLVNGDKKSLAVIRNSDQQRVLEAKINDASASVTVTLLQPIEQSGSQTLLTGILVQAAQNDVASDPAADVVEALLAVIIRDNVSDFLVDDSYQTIEAVTTTGNVFDNDNQSEAPLTLESITYTGDGVLDTLQDGTQSITAPEGTLIINDQGAWSLAANRNQANTTVNPTLSFSYTASDGDGDVDSAEVLIEVLDGARGVIQPVTAGDTEVDYANLGASSTFSVSVTAGSDNLVPASFALSTLTETQLQARQGSTPEFISNGEEVLFSLASDGKTLTATTVTGAPVFILTVTGSQASNGQDLDGQVDIQWLAPLDHDNASGDSLDIELIFTATDTDGTLLAPVSGIFALDDGSLPTAATTAEAALAENDLDSGPAVTTGQASVNLGSDALASLVFRAPASQPAATSQGQPLIYQLSSPAVLVAVVAGPTYPADLGDVVEVFRVALDPLGSTTSDTTVDYTVTLSQPLDQPNSPGLSDGVLRLPLAVELSDFDGDSVFSTLLVEIADSDPAIAPDITLDVSETPLETGQALSDTDSTALLVESGLDRIDTLSFGVATGDPVFDTQAAPNALTSGGQPLTWRLAGGGVLQARTPDGTVIFKVTAPDPISLDPSTSTALNFSMEMLGSIDHVPAVTDTATLSVPVRFIDSDGTASIAQINITIADGLEPSISSPDPLSVAEVDIAAGSAQDTEVIFGVAGSDAIGAIIVKLDSGVFTSDGTVVELVNTSLTTWEGRTVPTVPTDPGDVVFTLSVTPDGSTSFELLAAIKHAPPPAGTLFDENNAAIKFTVEALDVDGDSTGIQDLVVNVTDGIPTSPVYDSAAVPELTEGQVASGNLFTDANVLTQGSFGPDAGDIFRIEYKGQNYRFVSDASDPTAIVSDPISIDLKELSIQYGTLTIQSSGDYVVEAENVFNLVGSDFGDQISYDFVDNDGDSSIGNVYRFKVADGQGAITLSPDQLLEDNPDATPFVLTGNPGDVDNGENIVEFKIEKASLNGGILTLGTVELSGDATHYIISESQLVSTNSGVEGEKRPDGMLVFEPAPNSSNQTQSVTLNVQMKVDKTIGSDDVVTDSFAVSVVSVADVPEWPAGSLYTFAVDEDGGRTALLADPAQLQDNDGSEALTYEVISLDTGLALFAGSRQLAVTSVLTAAEFAQLSVESDENRSGLFNFILEAIATESENGDRAPAEQLFEVDVKGVADVPTLTVRNLRGTEDTDVPILDAFEGSLTDDDGSESLWFKVFLPDGWGIQNAPNLVTDPLDGSVFVSFADIQAGAALRPKEDLSQVTAVPIIRVRAVAFETPEDGVFPEVIDTLSAEKSFTIQLSGVADEPLLTPGPDGLWNYDNTTATLSATTPFDEDSRIPLNFGIDTEDDDGSENISLNLSGLPAGTQLFDRLNNEVFLPVFDASDASDPVFTVTQAELAGLFLQPPEDFSGEIALRLQQINTEPDGDSNATDIMIIFVVSPVVDTDDGQNFGPDRGADRDNENALEDIARPVIIDVELDDIDGSERLTDLVFLPGFEGALSYNGSVLSVPPGGLSMADLAIAEGITLTAVLTAGDLQFQAPDDRNGDFFLDFTYDITDSNGGASSDTVSTLTGQLLMDVRAQVDQAVENAVDFEDTRLENTGSGVLVSTDGSPIDLSGQLQFFEEDLDGSEVIDYVMITMPATSGWFVEQPLGQVPPIYGAIHDGFGNWLLRPPGNTSATVQEQFVEILDSVTISSLNPTAGPVSIQVAVRIKDGINDRFLDDAEILSDSILVQFDAGSGGTVAFTPDNIVDSIVDGSEGTGVRASTTMAEHIDDNLPGNGVAGDADDAGVDRISFRVDAADLPFGAGLAGTDVRAMFAADGTTLISYVFGEAALQDLTLVNVDEDFAGRFEIPINSVATDPSGDVKTNVQIFTFNFEPRVDQLDLVDADDEPFEVIFNGAEDASISVRYDYQSLLGDQDTDASRGVEEISSLTFSELQGGSFLDPLGILDFDSGTNSYTLTNPTDLRLSEIFFRPPENYSGQRVVEDGVVIEPGLGIDVSFEITDTTTGNTVVGNADSNIRGTTLYFNVDPRVDDATLGDIDTVTGNEDSKINIAGLRAELIDTDGSESLSLQITGVPEGAVIFARGVQLANNGLDGGTVSGGDLDGLPTYSWSVTPAQLPDVQIQPPQDFSGDIVLTLEAITNEKGTGQFASSTETFTVGVLPVADGVQLTLAQLGAQGDEGESIDIAVGALVLESVNPNEVVELSVTALASSDPSALIDLSRILVGTEDARFSDNGDGSFTATLSTTVANLEQFTLRPGDVAWGRLGLQVDVSSVDEATVLGSLETDQSATERFTVQIDIAPDPDPALLTRQFDGIIASNGINVNMGLSVTPVNPAPGETTVLEILSLPSAFSFNQGVRQAGSWLIDLSDPAALADLENLELITDTGDPSTDPSGSFNLQLRTLTTLDGETARSTNQALRVTIRDRDDPSDPVISDDQRLEGTNGDDYFEGGPGADVFIWRDEDQGTVFSLARDQVADLNSSGGFYNGAESDRLDLSGLFSQMSVTDGPSADQVIDVDDASGDTVFAIKVDGALVGPNQQIRLLDTTRADLMPSYVDGSTSESDFLQYLIDNSLLQVS